MLSFILLALIGLGFGVVDGIGPCEDCEFHYCEVFFPVQGVPAYAQPVFSAAGQLLYNYSPKIYPIHVFQIAGGQKIVGLVKVLKPGILSNLVVEITNLGIEVECKPLYSFEAFALFVGVPPLWALAPLRHLPCPRTWLLEVEISPAGNLTEYHHTLKNFTAEILLLRKVGIILDVYKLLGIIPAQFMIFGCGTPTFFDQLSLSISSMAEDYGSVAIGRVVALTKWNPLIGGKGGSCYWGNAAAELFPTGKKK